MWVGLTGNPKRKALPECPEWIGQSKNKLFAPKQVQTQKDASSRNSGSESRGPMRQTHPSLPGATSSEEQAMAAPQKVGGSQRPQGAPRPAAKGKPQTNRRVRWTLEVYLEEESPSKVNNPCKGKLAKQMLNIFQS